MLKNTALKSGFLGILLLATTVTSVGARQQETEKPVDIHPYVVSANEFGFKLLKQITSEGLNGNVFISPSSILFCLSMASSGAEGPTQDSMRAAMQLSRFTSSNINNHNSYLLKALAERDTNVRVNIANSLWLNQGYGLTTDFNKECRDDYLAQTFERDFRSDKTLKEINAWVSEKTNGRINSILDRLNPDDVVILLNAMYFYGKWTFAFDSTKTKAMPFFLLDGTEKRSPRMTQYHTFEYYENSKFQAIRLPYGDRFSMVIVLPRDRDGLPAFVRDIDSDNWEQWSSRFARRPGFIGLPRFKSEYSVSLMNPLANMGMEIAFGNKANFQRMTTSPVYISNILQKTFVDVNERGTEAVAVTTIMAHPTSVLLNPPKPFEMIVDHPFFCIIQDKTTGLILFEGAIVDPRGGA